MSSTSALPLPPAARPVVELIGILGAAAEIAARKAARSTFRAIDRRDGHRRLTAENNPESESATPMWDALADQLYLALQRRGARARLARHLGVPRQRISDFVKSRRLPDAEATLRILHWLAEFQAGRDTSLLVPPDPQRFPPKQG